MTAHDVAVEKSAIDSETRAAGGGQTSGRLTSPAAPISQGSVTSIKSARPPLSKERKIEILRTIQLNVSRPASVLESEPFLFAFRCEIRFDQIHSPYMKRLSATEVARNFSAVLDAVERDQEEIVLVRNDRAIARLIPEPPQQDALSVFADLYRTLDDSTAEELLSAIKSVRKGRRGRVSELKNPWDG